jgi:hypothetical protein
LDFLTSPDIQDDVDADNGMALVSAINDTITYIFDIYPPTDFSIYDTVDSSLATLGEGYDVGNNASTEIFTETFRNLTYDVIHSVYQKYGFEDPDSDDGALTGSAKLQNDYNVISLVFIYFFVAAGVTLILMGVLNMFTLPKIMFTKAGLKQPGVWGKIGIFFVVGGGIAGLAGLVGTDAGYNLSSGPWLLPVVSLGLVIVLGVQYVRWPRKTQLSEEL